MPPNRFESEVESFLEGSHGDRTHIKRADHPRLHHYAGRYLLGEFCTGLARECPVLGEFFRGLVGERVCWASFFAYTGTVAGYHR